MANRKDEKITVVIVNPERLPEIKKIFTKVLYEDYIRATSKDKLRNLSK